MKWTRDRFALNDEREKVDAKTVHGMLIKTHWAKNRCLETVQGTVDSCLCFTACMMSGFKSGSAVY